MLWTFHWCPSSFHICSSTSKNLISCSLLTFCLYSLICLFYGDDICGTSTLCLPIQCWHYRWCHSPLHHLLNPASMLSCYFLTFDPKVPPSLALLFLLITLPGDYVVAFLLFSNATCISSLVFLTLACGLCGFSFQRTNIYLKIFAKTRAN